MPDGLSLKHSVSEQGQRWAGTSSHKSYSGLPETSAILSLGGGGDGGGGGGGRGSVCLSLVWRSVGRGWEQTSSR